MAARVYRAFICLVLLVPASLALLTGCGGDEPKPPNGSPGPDHVLSVTGNYFKAVMGDTITDRSLFFAVSDIANNNLPGQWLHFNLLTGDGTLSADSVQSDSSGLAHLTYRFNGTLGHAEIEYLAKGVDSGEIQLRANTLIPGAGGQGQYVLFTDTYGDAKHFNGLPVSVDVDPTRWINYANYENTQNVVFVINDINQDTKVQETEDVLVVILTNGYTGKTKDSIGVGSSYNEIKAAYGPADTVYRDPTPPPALAMKYDSLGMLFYLDTVAVGTVDTLTTAFEIHMDDFVPGRSPAGKAVIRANKDVSFPQKYRRSSFNEH